MICPECGFDCPEDAVSCPECGASWQWSWVCPRCLAKCEGDVCEACGCPLPGEDEDPEEIFFENRYADFLPKEKKELSGCTIAALAMTALFIVLLICFAIMGAAASCGDDTQQDEMYFTGLYGNENVHEYQINSYYKPAGIGVPMTYADYEYSAQKGAVWSKYTITLVQVYRGEEAIALISGDIPEISEGKELYIARYRVKVEEQHVSTPINLDPAQFRAYSAQGEALTALNISDGGVNFPSVATGQSCEGWAAFEVDKGFVPVLGYKNSTVTSGIFFAENGA